MIFLNPYFLIVSGLIMIVMSSIWLNLSPKRIVLFWFRFLLYFTKEANRTEELQEQNPSLSLPAWIFVAGWIFLIGGVIRLLSW